MTSPVLRWSSRALVLMLLLFGLFLLGRGHDDTGGGFAGGVTVAIGFSLHSLALGVRESRRLLRISPIWLAGLGLTLMLASGVIPAVFGEPFLTAKWLSFTLPGGKVELGTTILFDLGVFLLVSGGILSMLFGIEEE